MLSAEELMKMRTSKAHPRSLPSMPPKEFVPTNSAEEAATIKAMIDLKMTYLEEQRAEKRNLLTKAEWLPKEAVARVDIRLGGGWDVFGFDKNGITYLQPEEALFLIELSRLELWYSGTPVSVQQAYQILLTEELCPMPKYRVYSHLCRQGYRLVRRNSPPAITKRCDDSIKVSSPKRAKIEVPGVDYQAEYIRVPDNPETFKSLFLPPAAEASDYDCIPNLLPGTGTIQINFLDLELLPESIRNRKTSYVVNKKDFKSMESHSNLNLDSPSTAMNTSSMEEISRDPSAMFTLTNNPLYDGETKPLLVGSHIGDPRYTLEVFDPTIDDVDEPDDSDLLFCYNVYTPGKPFRKSCPGPPCYILAIADWSSFFPSLSSLVRFQAGCGPSTVPLIAVSSLGSDISFYNLKGDVSPL